MLDNLKMLREEAHISQKALAEAIGVSQQSINKYENHNIEPDIETLVRIADHFDTSVDFVIGHTNIRHKIEPVQSWELNATESSLIQSYRALTPKQRVSIDIVLENYLNL